ncbi:DUF4241 domain-containing protein [Antribacter gilvus]|uniref:DUF4241 domain-containing protein n=1 Tax=Antribacter gilvus TaxID=2304675 RepID=UPI000F774638|nr:DUF4241 domain-containing protein [Antribacter gilvus]
MIDESGARARAEEDIKKTAVVSSGACRRHRVIDVGLLEVPSGRLLVLGDLVDIARDDPELSGLVLDVPPGTFPVRATVLEEPAEDDPDVAYLSVCLRDGEPTSVEIAGEIAGMSGVVGFVDHDAVAPAWSTVDEEDREDLAIYGLGPDNPSWLDTVNAAEHSAAIIPLPGTGPTLAVVAARLQYGGACLPVWVTRDASGGVLGVHIDSLVHSVGVGRS